jgi:glycosyltransferase involved in cell wall biosynthesis
MGLSTLQLGMHWFPERPGGLDRVYWELARALPGAGVGFSGLVAGTGLCTVESGGAVEPFAAADASLPVRLWGMRRAFERKMLALKPDLIVAHFALYALPVVGRLGGRKLVVHFQGPWADEGVVEGNRGLRHLAKRWVEMRVYRRATRIIVLSEAFREVLTVGYDVGRERIVVVPGGIDARRFAVRQTREEARARMGWPAGRRIVVAVRRLVPRMGLENLVAAMAAVRAAVPDALLLIAGRGRMHEELAAQVAALGLGEHVRLIGFVSDEDLPLFYRAADVSVVPSVALEGFGLVAAESLAAGTPCLVTPVGGLPEVAGGLSAALVMKSALVDDMAAAIRAALLREVALPDEQACRDYAQAAFSWDLIARRVAEVYAQALRDD